VFLFALWKLGAIVVPFDHEMNPEAAERIILSVNPRCAIVGYDESPVWANKAQVLEWWEPRAEPQPDGATTEWNPPTEQLATISFTSGTTGQPKGCMITHANLCSQVEAAFSVIPLDSTCRLASILPLSHLFELTCGLLYPLAAGAAIHYIPTRRGPDIVRVLSEQRITHMMVVPELLVLMGQQIDAQLSSSLPPFLYRAQASLAQHVSLPGDDDTEAGDAPDWVYTWGRCLRVLSLPFDLLYRSVVTRTVVLGGEHLCGLPSTIVFAGTHHSFADVPLVRRGLELTPARSFGQPLLIAAAAGGTAWHS
jgi:acyl-CoA synthetase (AMP-forming)/AMP-acid ligase II